MPCSLVLPLGRGVRRLAPLFPLSVLVMALGCREAPTSPTTAEPTPVLATTLTGGLTFRQVSAGPTHTCGVAWDGRAYCWGFNWAGQVGDGTTTDRFLPAPVAGGRSFRHVEVGIAHSCGVTGLNRIYCWGGNAQGQLGDGTFTNRSTPVAVAGGSRFRQVRAGTIHTCAINLVDEAFCWGDNGGGGLGDGTLGTNRATPVRVLGGLRWRQLSAGNGHTCGANTLTRAYCWGYNGNGQLGDGTNFRRLRPALVAGGLRFRQVEAGGAHTCGVTSANQAYCWGYNGEGGQLGDGTTADRWRPTAVAGRRQWDHLSAGYRHTCGVTVGREGLCWGDNFFGQLGDGTTTDRLEPVPVGNGLTWGQVSAGTVHTCGVTPERHGYCWGENSIGQVGVIPRGQYPIPVRVVGPM